MDILLRVSCKYIKIFQLIYIVFGHFIACYLQLNKNISVNLYHLWTFYCVLVANI